MHIVLIKPDGIGDYFLYRNFPPLIKKHFGPGCRLTGVLKPHAKGLADVLDRDVWDRILWLEPKKLITSRFYRLKWQGLARFLKADLIVYPVVSRYSPVDWLVHLISAKEKIASMNDLKSMSKKRSQETDGYYTRLIPYHPNRPRFEFRAYQDFLRAWLSIEPPETSFLEASRLPVVEVGAKPYALIFPGAGQESRAWPVERFGELARYLIEQHDLDVFISGPKSDLPKARSVVRVADHSRVTSCCGKYTMAEVASISASASVVVSNDSAPFHMAAALRTPFVMISSTRDYGRYHPYPTAFNLNSRYVYPPQADVWLPEKETYVHMKKVHEEAKPLHRIEDVTLQQVMMAVDEVLTV